MTVEEMIEIYQEKEKSYQHQIYLQREIIKNHEEIRKILEEKCKLLEQENEKLRIQFNMITKQLGKKSGKKFGKN